MLCPACGRLAKVSGPLAMELVSWAWYETAGHRRVREVEVCGSCAAHWKEEPPHLLEVGDEIKAALGDP